MLYLLIKASLSGIIIAIGDVSLEITDDFSLAGIAFGTIVCLVMYHLARAIAPPEMKDDGTMLAVGRSGLHHEEDAPDQDEGSHRSH